MNVVQTWMALWMACEWHVNAMWISLWMTCEYPFEWHVNGTLWPSDWSFRYSLLGLISHVGKNTGCGHYVAHIRKDGRWAIFDDRKVNSWCKSTAMRCDSMRCSTVVQRNDILGLCKWKRWKAMKNDAKQRKATQRNAKRCKAMQSHAKPCKAMQSDAKRCKVTQSNATQCNAMQNSRILLF